MTLVRIWVLGQATEVAPDAWDIDIATDFPHVPGPYQLTGTRPPYPIMIDGEPSYLACAGGSDLSIFSRTVTTEGIRGVTQRLDGVIYPNAINAGAKECVCDHSILGAINSFETAPGSEILKYCIIAGQVWNSEDDTPAAIAGMGEDEPMPGARKLAARDYLARWDLDDEATTWFTNHPTATPIQFMLALANKLKGLT